MLYRVLPLFLLAIALALFASMPATADDTKDANTHEGTVVSVTADKLVMKTKDGDEHTHTLAPKARITLDGLKCTLEDLKPGLKIRVTTKKDDKTVATKIQALDKNKDFEKD